MRLSKAIFHKIGPFDHAEIDLELLGDDARLVALCGVNGAGKTFSLQAAIAGAAYRKMPTQGTLVSRATARDSYVESTLVNGQRWVVRHDLDAVSRKGEATVKDAAGKEAYKGTSVKLFDAWSAKHFTAPDVLFATQFAVQKSGGFVDLGSAERTSIVLQVTGVQKIERWAKYDREQAALARRAFETLDARLADEKARCGDAVALDLALAEARALAETWDGQVTQAREALDAARAEALRITALAKENEATGKRRSELLQELDAARVLQSDLEKRISACRAIIADRDQIRGAAARIAEIDTELARLGADGAQLQADLAKAEAEHNAAREQLVSVCREKRTAEERAARLTGRLAEEGKVKQAVAGLDAQRQAVESASAALQSAEAALTELQAQRLTGAAERILGLRKGLSDIADASACGSDSSAWAMIADNTLDVDDEAVTSAAELPGRQRTAEGEVRSAKAALVALERELTDGERLAARAPEFVAARAELEATKATIADTLARETAADQRVATAHNACEPLRAAVAPIRAQEHALRAEREPLVALAGKADLLTKAEVLIGERETQLAAAHADLGHITEQLSATPEPAIPPPAPDVAAFSKALTDAEKLARQHHAAAAVAAQRLTAAQEGLARLCELQAEHDDAAAELADWNLLAADFGRDGCQSAEVDSAGPELTALTNQLLHTCHGPQFTVSIETSRLSSDGKGEIEECRVQVIDSVQGREGEAREFSGGQSVIIGEAISLALTILACNRAHVSGITLVRDESGAALDPVAGRAYVKMLRLAADLVKASRVLLVTHSKECAEMCDARILIKDGTVSYA